MAGPDLDSLTPAVDSTYADDGGDPTVQLHQRDHDVVHEAARALPVQTQAATSYEFVLTDAGKVTESTAATAATWTVPPQTTVAWPDGAVLPVRQAGAGTLTIAGGAGVTVRSRGSLTDLAGQWADATLHRRASDEWVLVGDLA